MTIYSYNINTYFPTGAYNFNYLRKEINDSAISTATVITIKHNREHTEIDITFNSALSGGDQTILDSIVSAHVAYIPSFYDYHERLQTRETIRASDVPVRIFMYKFPGTIMYGNMQLVTVTGYMDPAVTSYDVEIVDTLTDTTVGTGSFTNTTEAENIITLSTQPENRAFLEFRVKKIGGTVSDVVYIENFDIYI